MNLHRLLVLLIALAAFVLPATARAACRHTDVVFYSTDSVRLAQRLNANRSACADYWISTTPGGTDGRLPRAGVAATLRANGAHAMPEVRPGPWAAFIAGTGESWFQAGQDFRRLMPGAGFDVTKGDTWALQELGSDVLLGNASSRADMAEFIRGLATGDGGSAVEGLVFMTTPLHVSRDLGTYEQRLQAFFGDTLFWNAISPYVKFWAQETYADAREWGQPGLALDQRRDHLNDYFMHALRLADAGPGTAAAARAVLRRTYAPLGNIAWPKVPNEGAGTGFGYTNVSTPLLKAFLSTQTYALRTSTPDRFGFAWSPPTGVSDAVTIGDRLAAAIHDSDAGDASAACGSDLSACAGDVDVQPFAPNPGWSTVAEWTPAPNTFPGSDVTVAAGNGITVRFASVSWNGFTSAASANGGVFDIASTATWSGPVAVCAPYDAAALAGRTPRLVHGGTDVTTTLDPATHVVCGGTADLGHFTVVAAAPPVLTVPDGIAVTGSEPDGVAVTWAASATSTFDPSPKVSCSPASGSVFPYGTTRVTCTARDSGVGVTTAGFDVVVRDGTPPVVEPQVDGTPGANGWYTSDVVVSWTVADAQSTATTCDSTTVSSDTDGITLTCSSTSEGGTTTRSVEIKRDATGPAVAVTPGRDPDHAGWYTHPFAYATTGTDATSGLASCSPGASYAGPETAAGTVSGSCTDAAGNTATASFAFRYDATAPVLTAPGAVTADATSPLGAAVSYAVTAADGVDASLLVLCTPASGSTFAIGTTAVSCTATDAAGNTANATFSVTVTGAAEQLAALLRAAAAAAGLEPQAAVLAKLVSAAVAAGHRACGPLTVFEQLAPRVLGGVVAAPLVADSARIRAVLGC